MKTNNLVAKKNEETKTFKVKDMPNIVNGLSRTILDGTYHKTVDEKTCRRWLNLLGLCTLIIKKTNRFTELLPKIDKEKEKVNVYYDSLLDNRLGAII